MERDRRPFSEKRQIVFLLKHKAVLARGFSSLQRICQNDWPGDLLVETAVLVGRKDDGVCLLRPSGLKRCIFIGFLVFAARTDAQTVILNEPRKRAVTLPTFPGVLSGTPSGRKM